jgi:AcrR family transcriptional regulator
VRHPAASPAPPPVEPAAAHPATWAAPPPAEPAATHPAGSPPSGSEPPASARRRPRAAERRAQILREASRCFGTRGFHGTTTRDVAAAVGITEAALYRHFPGKEAIYAAILDERIAAPDPLAPLEPSARAGDDRAVFTGLALALLQSVEADPSFLRLLLYSALEGHEMARPFQETRIRRFREFLAGYLERRAREGAFRAVDPALGARAFIGMVVDHLIVRQVFGQRDAYPQPPEEVAETFVSIFLDGVRAGDGVRARRGRARRG